jgi:hypothetical protein
MALETGTTINSLVSSNPTSGDPFSQGDDHLRLIKAVLKATFKSSAGVVWAGPLAVSPTELNYCAGVTSNIQTQINNVTPGSAAIPAGTVMPFFQAAAPTGWTKITTHNNKMLRVVSGSGGGSGGIHSPILMDKIPSHTHVWTGAVAGDGAHTHTYTAPNYVGPVQGGTGNDAVQNKYDAAVTSSSTHTHTVSGTNAVPAGAINWQPLYIDMIICSKNAY